MELPEKQSSIFMWFCSGGYRDSYGTSFQWEQSFGALSSRRIQLSLSCIQAKIRIRQLSDDHFHIMQRQVITIVDVDKKRDKAGFKDRKLNI